MTTNNNITGFVLAGGKSTRMGRDKGVVQINGRKMIEHVLDAIKPICSSVIIIANNSNYDYLGLQVHSDIVKNKGPLSGICTALSISQTPLNIIVSCDSPFISSDLISYLLNQLKDYDVVSPFYKGKTYPLTSVYKKSCLKTLQKHLDEGLLKVKDSLKELNTNIIEISPNQEFFDKKILSNINTPEELRKYEHSI